MPQEFFLEHPSGLEKQTAVDRFVGDVRRSLIWIGLLKLARDLFRRPLQCQFVREESLKGRLCREPTALRPSRVISRSRSSFRHPVAVALHGDSRPSALNHCP